MAETDIAAKRSRCREAAHWKTHQSACHAFRAAERHVHSSLALHTLASTAATRQRGHYLKYSTGPPAATTISTISTVNSTLMAMSAAGAIEAQKGQQRSKRVSSSGIMWRNCPCTSGPHHASDLPLAVARLRQADPTLTQVLQHAVPGAVCRHGRPIKRQNCRWDGAVEAF